MTAPTVETITPDRSYRVTLGRRTVHVTLTDQPAVYLVNDTHTIDLSSSIPVIDGHPDHTDQYALHTDACNYVAGTHALAENATPGRNAS